MFLEFRSESAPWQAGPETFQPKMLFSMMTLAWTWNCLLHPNLLIIEGFKAAGTSSLCTKSQAFIPFLQGFNSFKNQSIFCNNKLSGSFRVWFLVRQSFFHNIARKFGVHCHGSKIQFSCQARSNVSQF
ncbi:hypothetical protein Leryth_012013 [Lithospermum erythrorhizon]|nr:hypothetical protein Leryth_012013 [Lithospermum erythrorhizon]